MLRDIISYFKDNNCYDLLDKMPKINISGYPNSCAVHQIVKIGLTGKIKRLMANLLIYLKFMYMVIVNLITQD